MNILGIDPGVKSGWALYDSVSRSVVDGGEFDEFALMDRRQAVIETLQEEVELEDVSRSDATRGAMAPCTSSPGAAAFSLASIRSRCAPSA